MEPVVDYMADLLSAVTTVLTTFVTWISTITTALISNPIVQLAFAICIIVFIIRMVYGWVLGAGQRRGRKRRR